MAGPRTTIYKSGSDYLLEYGDTQFSFNEEDFAERVEQAAARLGFVKAGLNDDELQDLVTLAVAGEIREPASPLGEHIIERWPELAGPRDQSLVYWLRRLVFRSAWLDQKVKQGELDVVFRDETRSFGYVDPSSESDVVELSTEPSWAKIAYHR